MSAAMKIKLSTLSANAKMELVGFKIAGVLPLRISYIKARVHILLCGIRAQITDLTGGKDNGIADYYDYELQKKLFPLLVDYIATALVNDNLIPKIFEFSLRRKIKKCGYIHIMDMYNVIKQLDDPRFFLQFWTQIHEPENTLLREDAQSKAT